MRICDAIFDILLRVGGFVANYCGGLTRLGKVKNLYFHFDPRDRLEAPRRRD
jgi:hypothetical protein